MQGSEYKIEETNKGLRKILTLGLGLILVVVLTVCIYYFTKVNQAYSSQSREVTFTVEKGSSTKQIANKLYGEKVISSAYVFMLYTTLNGAGNKIQAGEYLLDANTSIAEIVDILTHGKVVSNERAFTTIEGWTNVQIAMYLKDRQLVQKETEFADALQNNGFDFRFNEEGKKFNYQGFLFPDTYKIGKSETAQALAQRMLTNFEFKFTDKMLTDMLDSGKSLEKVIILASIIEKEVGRNKENIQESDLAAMQKEREIVASVFYNRLEVGMPLESDATVNYITGKSDRQALLTDTKVDSPYNTYRVRGLPPGPISNPGIGSIMAAIYPSDTDYLYFLNKPDGEAIFSKTYPEHIQNKAKYLD